MSYGRIKIEAICVVLKAQDRVSVLYGRIKIEAICVVWKD